MPATDKKNTAPGTPFDKAMLYLRALIKRHRQLGNNRLPTVKEIARAGRFSASTITMTLRELRDKGIITSAHRRGIMLTDASGDTDAPPFPAPSPRAHARWEHVRTHLAADLLTGAFPPESVLPSYKELSRRYGACYANVRDAAQSLIIEGRLVVHKRGLKVRQSAVPRSRSTIVLITPIGTMDSLGRYTPRAQEFWRTLERECHRIGVGLEVMDYEAFLRNPAADRQTVLGYMVWMVTMQLPVLDSLLRRLAALGRPVSFLEEMPGNRMPLPQILSNNPLFAHLCLATGDVAGRIAGEYLLDLGHRTVAFFSLVEKDEWFHNRLNGIRGVYAKAGLPAAVRSFSLNRYDNYNAVDRDIMSLGFSGPLLKSLGTTASALDPTSGENGAALLSELVHPMRRRFIRSRMRPIFDTAFNDKSITAWVGVNDPLALAALDYLRQKGVRAGRDISVVGFDDTVEAFGSGLSSYNFNVPAIVGAMFDHILGPKRDRTKHPPMGVEIPGMVMTRQSTGVAQSAKD